MKDLHAVLLMEAESGERLFQLAHEVGISMKAKVVSDLSALKRAFDDPSDLLLSFGTSVIVPESLLELPGLLALNVHAASPNYPGRDPHHFAVYDGATQYGATLHFMTPQVDAGQILDMELFTVREDVTPVRLLELANQAAWMLLERLFGKLADDSMLRPMEDAYWGKRKTTRKMFMELCRVNGTMSEAEFSRRMRSTAMPGYNNLYVEMHGYRFRIEGKL